MGSALVSGTQKTTKKGKLKMSKEISKKLVLEFLNDYRVRVGIMQKYTLDTEDRYWQYDGAINALSYVITKIENESEGII
jgi:hypothetical protein